MAADRAAAAEAFLDGGFSLGFGAGRDVWWPFSAGPSCSPAADFFFLFGDDAASDCPAARLGMLAARSRQTRAAGGRGGGGRMGTRRNASTQL